MPIGAHRGRIINSGTQNQQLVPSKTWEKALPCESVQHAYTNARTHNLNTVQGPGLRAQTEAQLGGGPDATAWYDQFTRTLQARDLTINLQARGWFLTPNLYDSYAQMYERAIDKASGEMILTDTAVNKATDRAFVDDNVTFPQGWKGPKPPSTPFAMPRIPIKFLPQHPTKAGGKGGLDPRFKPSNERIMGRMMTGDLKQVEPGKFKSSNKLFNPKTKQVFAALNYGKRPHGSNTYYGMSHFVLKSEYKSNAIYFPRDTFYGVGSHHQVSYQTLAPTYLHANDNMRQAIWDACVNNMVFPDTDDGEYLLEAHIFEKMRFTAMSELFLYTGDLDPAEKSTVITNAENFCIKWGIVFWTV